MAQLITTLADGTTTDFSHASQSVGSRTNHMTAINQPSHPYQLPASNITHTDQVTAYTVFNRRRFLTGFAVWIGDEPVKVFQSRESQEAYCLKMDAVVPAGVEFRVSEKRVTVDIGPAVYGVDYGKGSVKHRFGGGYVPRKAYQFETQ